MFADGALCNPSWFERLATSSLLAGQVSQFDVNHAQVTNGLDVAVGIHKGIISMTNPRYAEVWKLLGQLVQYSGTGQSGYDACATPNAHHAAAEHPVAAGPGQGRRAVGRQLVHPAAELGGLLDRQVRRVPRAADHHREQPLATGTSTVGVIGGPNGNGQWGVTSQQADHTMTPAKTKTVMNFLAWLFTPQHLGYWIKINQSGADIPTETGRAHASTCPASRRWCPTGKVPHRGGRGPGRRAVHRGHQLRAPARPGRT